MENWLQTFIRIHLFKFLFFFFWRSINSRLSSYGFFFFWGIQKQPAEMRIGAMLLFKAFVTNWWIHSPCLIWISNLVLHLWIIFPVYCLHSFSLMWTILHSTYGLKLFHFISLLIWNNWVEMYFYCPMSNEKFCHGAKRR